jgi:pantothenate kinase type III
MDSVAYAHVSGLDAVRRRRAELFESMTALEQALVVPTTGRLDTWTQCVDVALTELSADVRAHIAITEGLGGLHADVVTVAPRLAHAVQRLVAEHAVISEMLVALSAQTRATAPQVDDVRCLGADLIVFLDHHRRRGAALVFEAYQTDIGGET